MTDNTAEKQDSVTAGEIDEILDSIKETMNSEDKPNEEVLELTEKIDEKEGNSGSKDSSKEEPAMQLENILDEDSKEDSTSDNTAEKKEDDVIKKIDDAAGTEASVTSAEKELPQKPSAESATNISKTSELLNKDIANESMQAVKDLISKTAQDDSMRIGTQTTLEELTKELLKPQLSEWLNNNLQTIVEKVVQKEIRKILPND